MSEIGIAVSGHSIFADRPYRRGYALPNQLRSRAADAHQTRLGYTVTIAALDILTVQCLIVGGALAWTCLAWSFVAPVVVMTLLISARQLRGLECLVHEASHFNWSRRRRVVNDLLGFIMAGMPTGARIADYRTSHLLHHGQFGTARDPDRLRYVELDIEALDRSSYVRFAWGVAKRLPRYQLGWLRALGATPLNFLLLLIWAAVFLVIPAILTLGVDGGVVSGALWLASYFIVLPAIRFIAEAGEHVYRAQKTVFDATISNVGLLQRLLLHPHNDGFHTVHHLWPGIPHHALRRMHRLLVMEDKTCYAMKVRYRSRVLQEPRVGSLNGDGHAAASQKE